MKASTILNIKDKIKQDGVSKTVFDFVNIIKEKDQQVGALLELYSDADIEAQVAVAEAMWQSGKNVDMTGVPVVLKDNICV